MTTISNRCRSGPARAAAICLAALFSLLAASCTGGVIADVKQAVESAKEAKAPTVSIFSLTSPESTNVATVTFEFVCANASYYLINESATAPAANDQAWTGAKPVSQPLVGEGSHSLYAWAKSSDGAVSAAYAPITVVLDTTAPAITSFTLESATPTFDPALTISLEAGDGAGTGVDGWFLQYGSATLPASPSWLAASPKPVAFSINGAPYGVATAVYAWARDGAGNVSAPLSVNATLQDSGIPSISGFARTSAAVTNSAAVSFSLTPSANAAQLLFSESATAPTAGTAGWTPLASVTNTYTVSDEGAHTIYAWAMTSYGIVSSQAAPISMTLDSLPPIISSFTPALTHTDTTVISLSASGTDAGGTGIVSWAYADYASIQSSPPTPSAGWNDSATAPTSYSLSSSPTRPANVYVYAWAKDSAGNVSSPLYLTIDLRPIVVATLSGSATRVGHEPITYTFVDAMSLANLTIGGTMAASSTPSMPDAYTLKLTPSPLWPSGTQTLTITGSSNAGVAMTAYNQSFTVNYRIYVENASGSNANIGSAAAPKKTMRGAYAVAVSAYGCGAAWAAGSYYAVGSYATSSGKAYICSTAGITSAAAPSASSGTGIADGSCKWDYVAAATALNPVDVHVAAGNFSSDFGGTGEPALNIVPGASIYGGYATDWSSRGEAETIYTDSSTTNGTDYGYQSNNCAVFAPTGTTTATIVDGIHAVVGGGTYAQGITCVGSPRIQHCAVSGRTSNYATDVVIGIYSRGDAYLYGNTINPGTGSGETYGIWVELNGNTTIDANTIDAGKTLATGSASFLPSAGVYLNSANDPTILANTINSGSGGTSYRSCISIYGSNPTITGNTLDCSSSYGIFEGDASSEPLAVTSNDFSVASGYWYHDSDIGIGNVLWSAVFTTQVKVNGVSGYLCDAAGWKNYSTASGWTASGWL